MKINEFGSPKNLGRNYGYEELSFYYNNYKGIGYDLTFSDGKKKETEIGFSSANGINFSKTDLISLGYNSRQGLQSFHLSGQLLGRIDQNISISIPFQNSNFLSWPF